MRSRTAQRVLMAHRHGGGWDEDWGPANDLKVGAFFAYEWEPWRVLHRKVLDQNRWPKDWALDEATIKYYDGRVVALLCRPAKAIDSSGNKSFVVAPRMYVRQLPEHYSLCNKCGELQPCRELVFAAQAEVAMQELEKYQDEGVCPACREPVSRRQKSLTFPDNIYVPAGPPLTFHINRWRCLPAARAYEQAWVARDPGRRRATLPDADDGGWRSYPGSTPL
jgi:hypothetical protein